MTQSGGFYEFLHINIIMDEDYCRRVVTDALNGRAHVSAETRSRITAAIKQWVVIPGFRRGKSHTAVMEVLLPNVIREFHKVNDVAAAVLQTWLETKQNLQTEIARYLGEHSELVADSINWAVGFGGIWNTESMSETSDQFRSAHPDFDSDDVCLMLCIKLGRLPMLKDAMQDFVESHPKHFVEEQPAEEPSAMPSEAPVSLWKKQLDDLKNLPAESTEWDHIEDLGTELRKLAEAKIQARSQHGKDVLRLLVEIKEQAHDTIEYFGYKNIFSWDPSLLSKDQAKGLCDLLEDFKQRLLNYRSISQVATHTLAADRQKRSRLESAETELHQIYGEISSYFQESTPQQSTQAQPLAKEQLVEATIESGIVVPVSEKSSIVDTHQEDIVLPQTSTEDEKQQREKANLKVEEKKEKIRKESSALAPKTTEITQDQIREFENIDVPAQAALLHPVSLTAEPGKSLSESAARKALDQKDYSAWDNLVWALINDDDLGGAYWLVKAIEARGQISATPSWLLEAVQGARWIAREDHPFVSDLLDISKNHTPDTSSRAIGLLALSAALKPSLIAPFSGLSSWLQKPHIDALDKITDAVTGFLVETGSALHVGDIDGISGADERSNVLSQAVSDAKQWLVQAPQRRLRFYRANLVWHRLVGPKGELCELVKSAANDRKIDLEFIQNKIDLWRSHDYIVDRINKIDAETHKIKENPIIGAARDTLEGHISEAIVLVSRWYSLAKHEQEIKVKGNWIFSQVLELHTEISNNLNTAFNILDEMSDVHQPLDIRAASLCLKRSLIKVAEMLQISYETSIPASEWRENESIFQGASSLSSAIHRRLLLFPELQLSDDMRPSGSELERMPVVIATTVSESRTLDSAFIGWVKKQDYRFIDLFECRNDPEISAILQEAENSSRASLHDLQNELQSNIEQMIVDGIITDDDRARFIDRIVQIDPDQVRNFPLQFEALSRVDSELANAKRNRLDELKAVWKETSNLLKSSRIISSEKQQRITKIVESALERSDTRLVEEYISRIKPVIDAKTDWDDSLDKPLVNRDLFDEFNQFQKMYEEEDGGKSLEYVGNQILEGGTYAGITYGNIASQRREEAKNVVDGWKRLKQLRQRNDPLTKDYIKHLLSYLGFAFNTEHKESIKIENHGEDWLYVQAAMSIFRSAKPIYQFGSLAAGKYHVVFLWERPGADTIASRLRQLGLKHKNVLLFYLGRLGIKHRSSLIKLCYEDKFNLVFLDEVLLIFLTQIEDERFPAFLQCAVPFAAINPYTPFQAGDVPQEMFYGREEMIRELQDPKGSCLVYGGRQLGKSALLKQVERGFHNPEREQYAAVLDIKLLGSPDTQQSTDGIWRKILDTFKEFGIISSDIRTNKPVDIENIIRRAVIEKRERRVLIMFDEADNFLDADASEHFAITEKFRTLMLETNRQFKVVFAGLHNVQRFQGLSNQPFAHFGTPLLVGPLDPKEAISLIQEPMYFLGYRFSDSSGPLRILSFTNYHPGLIQLFCQELIDRRNNVKPSKTPPFEITQQDIEAIYRQVKERIKERFDWTLALDQAYQAIAWTMIYDQIQTRDSYAHTYPASDILAKLKEYLPQRFDKTSHVELIGLLDEMQGLGVLVRDSDSSYRLRSPNVVRLMGSETDIITRLVELMDKPPAAKFTAGSYHELLSKNLFSPLTYDEEKHLNTNKSGVCLIFASIALGLRMLPEVFKNIALSDNDDTTNDIQQIPLWVSSESDLSGWFEKLQIKSKNKERLFAYYSLDVSSLEEMESLVRGATAYCAKRRSKQVLRIYFIFNPDALKKWLKLDPTILKKLEDQVDVTLSPNVWNIDGIRHHLELINMVASEAACKDVLEATGGWPILLEHLLDRMGTKDNNPRDEAHNLKQELEESNSVVSCNFRNALGIDKNEIESRILKYLIELGGEKIPLEYISPEMLSKEITLTQEDCATSLELLTRINCIQQEAESVSVNPIVIRQFSS